MNIAIIDYPGAMQSAVHGLSEMFLLATQLCKEQQISTCFNVEIINLSQIEDAFPIENSSPIEGASSSDKTYSVVILPPGLEQSFYLDPAENLIKWLIDKYQQGSILCSTCAGSFIVAATGLLDGREATTHWGLVNLFKERYPNVVLHPEKIIVQDGDIITAGGVMAWVDLGLELVAQFTKPKIMRQLGKMLVVDTGQREQCYYQQFSPNLTHGDKTILSVQRKLQTDFKMPIKISELAKECCFTERTFLRRFVKATGIKPSEYLQRIRIQKACDLLENTQKTFEEITSHVGYEDISACRKIFIRIVGLTPREFKKRFV